MPSSRLWSDALQRTWLFTSPELAVPGRQHPVRTIVGDSVSVHRRSLSQKQAACYGHGSLCGDRELSCRDERFVYWHSEQARSRCWRSLYLHIRLVLWCAIGRHRILVCGLYKVVTTCSGLTFDQVCRRNIPHPPPSKRNHVLSWRLLLGEHYVAPGRTDCIRSYWMEVLPCFHLHHNSWGHLHVLLLPRHLKQTTRRGRQTFRRRRPRSSISGGDHKRPPLVGYRPNPRLCVSKLTMRAVSRTNRAPLMTTRLDFNTKTHLMPTHCEDANARFRHGEQPVPIDQLDCAAHPLIGKRSRSTRLATHNRPGDRHCAARLVWSEGALSSHKKSGDAWRIVTYFEAPISSHGLMRQS